MSGLFHVSSGSGGLVPRVPLGSQTTALMKSLQPKRASGKLPDYIHHHRSEAVRRYAMLSNSVLDDATPHLDAGTLRTLASRNLAIQAVLHTILNQVASHFVRPRGPDAIGLRVIQKEKRKALTAATAKEVKRVEDILFNGGVKVPHPETEEVAVWDSHGEEEADKLGAAVRKIMRDSLVLDKTFIAIESSMSGKEPVAFWKHVDAGLCYKVDTKNYVPEVRNGANGSDNIRGKVKYVQFAPDMEYRIDREYTWREGKMAFRNPQPEFLSFGYGRSEVEECLAAVTGVLYAMQANQDWFSRNHVPQGLITVFGNFDRGDIEDMRSQFQYEVGAVGGSMWTVPILSAPPQQGNAVSFTPFIDRTRMDMVSRTYLELCIAFIAAIFQIAPEEFGFHSFGGPEAALQESGAEDKLKHSQHKGLLPKVIWLLDLLQELVELINPDLECEIQGLEDKYGLEQLQKAQTRAAMLQNGATLQQLATEDDAPPVVDPIDDDLWDEVLEAHQERFYGTERERLQAVMKDYKAAGGKLGSYPDMPGNPVFAQVWMQEHGIGQQQQTQDQMGQMAGNEAMNQQAGEQAEKQNAQMGMQQFAQNDQEFAHGNDLANQEAAQKNELRIPGAQDAGFDMRDIRKALRVRRIGPRDE